MKKLFLIGAAFGLLASSVHADTRVGNMKINYEESNRILFYFHADSSQVLHGEFDLITTGELHRLSCRAR
jgi:hypothetical protein